MDCLDKYSIVAAERVLNSTEGGGDPPADLGAILDRVRHSAPDFTLGALEALVRRRERNKAQARALLSVTRPEQRTPEWFKLRDGRVTASELAEVMGEGKYGTQRSWLKKKAKIEKVQDVIPAEILEWGQRFEPVITEIYEARNGVRVSDIGFLPVGDYCGASPDGVSDAGVLLEIKAPWRRQITGAILPQYMYQMQLQMRAAQIDVCDFVEASFDALSEEAAVAAREDGHVVGRDATGWWRLKKYNQVRVELDHDLIERAIRCAEKAAKIMRELRSDSVMYYNFMHGTRRKRANSIFCFDEEDGGLASALVQAGASPPKDTPLPPHLDFSDFADEFD